MAGNKLVTLAEICQDMNRWWFRNYHYIIPSEMFIEGQYNWEREEFDDHG